MNWGAQAWVVRGNMQNRLRLLMGMSALLYFGPLLAGLTGMGWDAVPVFIALVTFWLVIMRPKNWPRSFARWTGETVLAAFAQVAVNSLIVILLFAAGRGLGGVAGFIPNIPPLVPVALSFLATPLSRLVWNPKQGQPVDDLVGEAITDSNAPEFRHISGRRGDTMLETLLSLPEDADPDLTAEALDAALRGREGMIRLSLLEAALDAPMPYRMALRHGLVLWGTMAGEDADETQRAGMRAAFRAAGDDQDMLFLFAARALHHLEHGLRDVGRFPPAEDVEMAISEDHDPGVQSALMSLAERLADLEYRASRA